MGALQGIFTFQYGSINTAIIHPFLTPHTSLHSNMVLLIRGVLTVPLSDHKSLHSNMVLLIRPPMSFPPH